MKTFGQKVIDYTETFRPDWDLPKGFELIFPYGEKATKEAVKSFYTKFFNDAHERIFLFGINPGRFGSGLTGIGFTDPFHLEKTCGIKNSFDKRKELSATFINEVIAEYGGPELFYQKIYITAVSQLGFLKEGKNINYYDDPKLEASVRPHIIKNIKTQIAFGANRKIAYSIGKGQNYKYLKALNKEYHFFDKIKPLPHPRWVLQYQRKNKDRYLAQYLEELAG